MVHWLWGQWAAEMYLLDGEMTAIKTFSEIASEGCEMAGWHCVCADEFWFGELIQSIRMGCCLTSRAPLIERNTRARHKKFSCPAAFRCCSGDGCVSKLVFPLWIRRPHPLFCCCNFPIFPFFLSSSLSASSFPSFWRRFHDAGLKFWLVIFLAKVPPFLCAANGPILMRRWGASV